MRASSTCRPVSSSHSVKGKLAQSGWREYIKHLQENKVMREEQVHQQHRSPLQGERFKRNNRAATTTPPHTPSFPFCLLLCLAVLYTPLCGQLFITPVILHRCQMHLVTKLLKRLCVCSCDCLKETAGLLGSVLDFLQIFYNL